MNSGKMKFAGLLLIFASITFWISWFLMPDQGTVDAEHILKIVRQHRESVFYSVIIQIISSVVFVPSLLLINKIQQRRGENLTLLGSVFLLVGAMGMCADAFFHLLAYFMSDNEISISIDIIRTMTLMQSIGVSFLLPFLLSFFLGCLLLSIGLEKGELISKTPKSIFIMSFILTLIASLLVNMIGLGRQPVVLSFLGLIAIGLTVLGLELMRVSGSKFYMN